MPAYIFKIGGSILFDGEILKTELIQKWIDVINDLVSSGNRVGIVIGGGLPARKYIKAASELGANKSYQDLLGIESARQNARLFIAALKQSYPTPPKNYEELIHALGTHDLVICGGFQPGQSTNAVAAIFSETIGAKYLFNITNIDKVYNKDPDKFNDAVAYDNLDYTQFANVLNQNEQLPGTYALFDNLGLDVVTRSRIKLVFINGNNPEYILDVINNKQRGTIIG